MTPGVVSEDLFRQQLQVIEKLAGAVADSGRTLGQVVTIQQVQHDQLKTMSEMLMRQDAAMGDAISEVKDGMKDGMNDMATGLRVHVSEQVTHAVTRMESTVAREVDRLEFWRKPAVVFSGLVALATLIVDMVLRIISAVKTG